VTATAEISDLILRAATVALEHVPIGDPLLVGEASTDASGLSFDGVAVTAQFAGAPSGEIIIAVEQSVADALANSPMGALDLAKALGPALASAVNSLGTVVLSPAKSGPFRPALRALLAEPGSCYVPLTHEGVVRAVVAIAVTAEITHAGRPSTPNYPTREQIDRGPAVRSTPPTADSVRHGLEILRDVAMEVTAQIGSTRMTVHELLSLADGVVVELDRAAGAPADLMVNGHLIARGEVVVIDENFGLRITEIVYGDDPPTGRS
jgi:flagellar motor switch protein FliN/FliY